MKACEGFVSEVLHHEEGEGGWRGKRKRRQETTQGKGNRSREKV